MVGRKKNHQMVVFHGDLPLVESVKNHQLNKSKQDVPDFWGEMKGKGKTDQIAIGNHVHNKFRGYLLLLHIVLSIPEARCKAYIPTWQCRPTGPTLQCRPYLPTFKYRTPQKSYMTFCHPPKKSYMTFGGLNICLAYICSYVQVKFDVFMKEIQDICKP